VQRQGYGQPSYCSSCLLNFHSFILSYWRIIVHSSLRNKLSFRLSTTKTTANNERMLSYSIWLLNAHNFSVTYVLFPKCNPFSFSWECSRSTASRLNGSQEGSLVFCPYCDDPKQCSSFICFAVPLSISFTCSPTRLLSSGSKHITTYFLQHSLHLIIKLLSLLALPKEIFCNMQVLILGSKVCKSPVVQVLFSQMLLMNWLPYLLNMNLI